MRRIKKWLRLGIAGAVVTGTILAVLFTLVFGQVSITEEGWLSFGISRLLAGTERQSPDVLIVQTNLSGSVSDIQDDPDSADGNWLEYISNNVDTVTRVSFPTPTGNPTVGVDLQEFKIWVRQQPDGAGADPTVRIELYENGSSLAIILADTAVSSTTGALYSGTWNANLLGTANGSLVECYIYGVAIGGAPGNRCTIEVGAVEWNVDYTTGPDITNLPSSKAFGIVDPSSTFWSNGSKPTWPLVDGDAYFTVTNNSGAAVDISIKATNFTGGVGWTITAGSPGENTIRLTVFEEGDGSGDGLVLTISNQGFIVALADSADKDWELKMETGTFTDGDEKTSTVTLTAVLS